MDWRDFSNGSTLHGKWVLTSRAYPKRVQSYIFFEKRETFPSLFFHFFFIIRLLPRLTNSKTAQSHGRASPRNLFLPMTCEDLGQKRILNRSCAQKSLTQVWCYKKFFNYYLGVCRTNCLYISNGILRNWIVVHRNFAGRWYLCPRYALHVST